MAAEEGVGSRLGGWLAQQLLLPCFNPLRSADVNHPPTTAGKRGNIEGWYSTLRACAEGPLQSIVTFPIGPWESTVYLMANLSPWVALSCQFSKSPKLLRHSNVFTFKNQGTGV